MKSLTIEEFGDSLLRTGDLDPVYVAIVNTPIDTVVRDAMLLAYWCFYHLGAAAFIAQTAGKQPRRFWELLMAAAVNEDGPRNGERWPRSAERRHFRGQQAVDSVKELMAHYKSPSDFVRHLTEPVDGATPTFGGVSARVQEHRGFGPWIAFKIADMTERVLGCGTDFSNCELGIYKDPRQGAALAYYENDLNLHGERLSGYDAKPWEYPVTNRQLEAAVAHYVAHWRKKKAKAPPMRDRLVNVQEIETIFCKYKSYRKGHYTVGKDIHEVEHGLEGWGDLATDLQRGLRKGLPK